MAGFVINNPVLIISGFDRRILESAFRLGEALGLAMVGPLEKPTRLEALEEIASSKPGVAKAYALQAGREIRVIVEPSEIDDDAAVLLSHEIAREIEDQLEYPGQVKVIATTTQLGDWARIVGGPDVSVHQLLQPNTDPHEYEPRPADVEATALVRHCSRLFVVGTAAVPVAAVSVVSAPFGVKVKAKFMCIATWPDLKASRPSPM